MQLISLFPRYAIIFMSSGFYNNVSFHMYVCVMISPLNGKLKNPSAVYWSPRGDQTINTGLT